MEPTEKKSYQEKKTSRWKRRIIIWFFIITILYLSRIYILQGIGDFLVKEDNLHDADAVFVLSGDPFDRGNEAIKIFNERYIPEIICTGSNISHNLKSLHLNYTESSLTRINLILSGVDSNRVKILPEGTSTKEEGDAIVRYCKIHNLKTVIILSSKFHTRRVHFYFDRLFKSNHIQMLIHGAPSSIYNESYWWKDEDGLITVNNEYVKLIYYLFKY